MTLTIKIKPEIENILRRRGIIKGPELANYVQHLIEADNNEKRRTFAATEPAISIAEKTFGSAGVVDRKDLITLAEDEEFSGY